MFDTKNSLPLPPPTTTSTATTDITTCSKPHNELPITIGPQGTQADKVERTVEDMKGTTDKILKTLSAG